jgi:hypothetical protein
MRFPKLSSYSRYTNIIKLLVFVGVLAAILNIAPTQPAKADDSGYDLFPWINTTYIGVAKSGYSYTISDSNFIADHFDEAVAKLAIPNDIIKQRNPHINIYLHTGLGSANGLNIFDIFLAEHPGHTAQEIEGMYIHYKCDVIVNDTNIPGCNLVDIQTGQCSGIPADGCTASSALALSESRVPESFYPVFVAGWHLPNYNSPLYADYGVWNIRKGIDLYGDNYPVDGIFLDNILYVGSYEIDQTIEYWGQPDTGLNHPRNDDYHALFDQVKNRVEQEEGQSLVWYGNVNNMWWIREETPHDDWVLSHLTHATSESWVSPLDFGERYTPFWAVGCTEMKDAWNYSAVHGLNLSVLTYNFPFEGAYAHPDQRTKVFSMAKFYLANNDHLFYGYSEDDLVTTMSTVWNNMAEINIGSSKTNPAGVKDFEGLTGTNKYFDWNNQTTQLNCYTYDTTNVVMARHYDNGLIIARWKGARWQTGTPPANDPAYNSYIDPRVYSVANPYHSQYYIVESDGTLSDTPVSSVTLRTNEATMLLQVCADGVVPSTCGCNGTVLNAGDTCITGTRPTLDSIDNISMTINDVRDIVVQATDPDCPDGQCLNFQISMPHSEAGIAVALTNQGHGKATIHIESSDASIGTSTILVVVTDNGTPPQSDTVSFNITVLPGQPGINHPPTIIEIPDKTIHEQELLLFDVIATDPDSDDTLTLSASNLPTGATFIDHHDRTGTFSWTPTDQQANIYPNIHFEVTDGTEIDTEDITITVLDGTASCTPAWECSNWSVCTDSLQTRSCHDDNNCGSDAGRPVETADCDSTVPGVVNDLTAI